MRIGADPRSAKFGLSVAIVGYLLILVFALDESPSIPLLVVVPILVAGGYFGMKAAAAVTLGLFVATGVAVELLGSGVADTVSTYWGIPFVLVAVVGVVVGRLHDVQARMAKEVEHGRQVEFELRASQAGLVGLLDSKDELIASLGHQLRTPLTAVLGFAEMLRLGDHSEMAEGDREEMVGLIARQAFELSGIVEDMIVAARIEIDRLEVTRVPTSLRAQVAQVIEGWDPDQLIKLRIKGNGTKAVADPARVRQILRNLITNALNYGGEDIEITIGVHDEGAYVVVADNGSSLPLGEWERIFDPYHRYHDEHTRPGSLGLGLTVSRRLAERMDGTLSYRHDGHQSKFTLQLPTRTHTEDQTSRR